MHDVAIVAVFQTATDLAEDVERFRRRQGTSFLLGNQIGNRSIRAKLHEDIELAILVPTFHVPELVSH